MVNASESSTLKEQSSKDKVQFFKAESSNCKNQESFKSLGNGLV
jgi:hypothetical protein